MKNTGTEYMSTDRTPTVRPDFSELLPPLSDEQLSLLEADILKNGCYTPVIVNEDMVIVDGHNRQRLCEEHGLPYQMAVFAFEDLLEAKQWALDTQKARRNLQDTADGKSNYNVFKSLFPAVYERRHDYKAERYQKIRNFAYAARTCIEQT